MRGAIDRAFRKARNKGWDKVYWFVDIHETMVRPNYRKDEIPTDFYPGAEEAMREISARGDVVLVLYTCSWPSEIAQYLEFFRSRGIDFRYVNENPEVVSMPHGYGCYDKKPYYDVLLEDKADFDAEEDWEPLAEHMRDTPLLTGTRSS